MADVDYSQLNENPIKADLVYIDVLGSPLLTAGFKITDQFEEKTVYHGASTEMLGSIMGNHKVSFEFTDAKDQPYLWDLYEMSRKGLRFPILIMGKLGNDGQPFSLHRLDGCSITECSRDLKAKDEFKPTAKGSARFSKALGFQIKDNIL